MDIAVVIATNRERCMKEWLAEWEQDLRDARVIVVEDGPEASFDLDAGYRDLSHHAWADIDGDLAGRSWIIPRRTSAVKSYGFLKAHNEGADAIWTLDDDCYPEPAWRGDYLRVIEDRLSEDRGQDSWWNTLGHSGMHPRGYPYGIRETRRPVMIHHGLWSGVPDLDGITALDHPDWQVPEPWLHEVKTVPRGMFPMCGMNLAFRREMTPAMYFMLMGHGADGNHWGFDRFDDIWAGLFAKRICDHLGYAVTSGSPSIRHTKESDPQERVRKEASGIEAHEKFWQFAAECDLDGRESVASCYRELAVSVECAGEALPEWFAYWCRLADAMRTWTELCA